MSAQMPILVPVDDPEELRAVHFAGELAGLMDAEVRVLSVVADANFVAAKETLLDDVLGRLAAEMPDLKFDRRVVVHDATHLAVVESAASASTVCMTTAATLLPHEGHFGSIAESVVRSLERPVVLLGPKATGELRPAGARLVLPLDGSAAGEFIVEDAGALASMIDAEVWVVTVVTPDQERELDAVAGGDSLVLESGYVRRIAMQISKASGREAQFEVLHDSHPARAILEFAGDDGLIAMSTHGRTGLRRIFAGSVTTDVVARARQPVMVVRPPEQALLGH